MFAQIRRATVQKVMQATGMAEETPDDEFKALATVNKENHKQLQNIMTSLDIFKRSLAGMCDASVQLAQALEVYYEPLEGLGPDEDILLVREYARKVSDVKAIALESANAMMNSTNDTLKHLSADYASLPAKFDERKDQIIQADAYKRKVMSLREHPPKDDNEKLPRNEAKLAKACSDLSACTNELTGKLLDMEKNKHRAISSEMRMMVDGTILFFRQSEVCLAGLVQMLDGKKGGGGAPKPVAAAALPSPPPAVAPAAAPVAAAPPADNPFNNPFQPAAAPPATAAAPPAVDPFASMDPISAALPAAPAAAPPADDPFA